MLSEIAPTDGPPPKLNAFVTAERQEARDVRVDRDAERGGVEEGLRRLIGLRGRLHPGRAERIDRVRAETRVSPKAVVMARLLMFGVPVMVRTFFVSARLPGTRSNVSMYRPKSEWLALH